MTTARGARYRHTNLIARDWQRLARFYETVFGCVRLPERDLSGEALERGSGVKNARLRGAHLRLPGFGDEGPTLEVFQYDEIVEQTVPVANRAGFGHVAFEVDDVAQALDAMVAHGGSRLSEVVRVPVAGAGTVCFTYARDPEGNIIELQSWA